MDMERHGGKNLRADIVVIGGGPAGLSAAVAAKREGAERVLILERDVTLGGILNQCIHNGFGLHTFKEELTGPEYAARFIEMARKEQVEYRLGTIVLGVSRDRKVTCMSSTEGLYTVDAGAVILAMGCRERPRGALNIPGFRPAGIYTAGCAQRLMNIEGKMVGRRVVILGSGDIGLIMARRMTLEGAKVLAVAELMPYSGGLKRNIVQCLNDYDIPLKLSHTVVDIKGRERVEGITIAEVDGSRKPIPGTEEYYEADTLLLSCGLLPENELTRALGAKMDPVTGGAVVTDSLETDIPGVFACGNVLHVHDLVDYVSEEAALAGKSAAAFVHDNAETSGPAYAVPRENGAGENRIPLAGEGGVRYTVPQVLDPVNMHDQVTVRFRVADVYKDKDIALYYDDRRITSVHKRVLAPGEMEQMVIKKTSFDEGALPAKIRIVLE